MAKDNVEIVRGVYAEWKLGNMIAGLDLFDPEIVFESFMPDSSERVVVHGTEEIGSFMHEWLAQWRDFRLTAEEFRKVGRNRVFVSGQQMATGRQSGVAVEMAIYNVWTFRNSRVVSLLFDRDRQRALEAAGLEE